MDREARKWLLRQIACLCQQLILVLIVAAFVGTVVSKSDRIPALMGIRTESAKDKELREAVEKLKKDIDIINQQLPIVISAHNRMGEGVQSALVQQNKELTVVARAMSDYFGQKKWLKMIAAAREKLDAEAKKAAEEADRAAKDVSQQAEKK
jgi:hypothetical protein